MKTPQNGKQSQRSRTQLPPLRRDGTQNTSVDNQQEKMRRRLQNRTDVPSNGNGLATVRRPNTLVGQFKSNGRNDYAAARAAAAGELTSSDELVSSAATNDASAVRHVSSSRRMKPVLPKLTSSISIPNITSIDSAAEFTNDSTAEYLDQNPAFLENYLMKKWTLEKLEHFLRRSLSPAVSDSSGATMYLRTPSKLGSNGQGEMMLGFQALEPVTAVRRMALYAEHETLIRNLAKKIHTHQNKAEILVEMVNQVATLIDASGANLYMVGESKEDIYLYSDGTTSSPFGEAADSPLVAFTPIRPGTTLAAYVAYTREPYRSDDFKHDERFADGIQHTNQARPIKAVIAYPLTLEDSMIGVVELYRFAGRPSFSNEHEAVVASFVVWGSLTAYDFQMYRRMERQKELNEFILRVTKSIFQDIVSLDNVMMKIMTFAKTLVNADRASLFLVDSKTNELYARIFDVGIGSTKADNEFVEAKEIRFPMSKGVAGFVASTGKTLNIADAYENEHFNRDIDLRTGYRTKTILCMPICVRGNIIGVVQMVNKTGGGLFTKSDEEAFDLFAVYCGLALHHAKLYDKIRRSEQKYKVAIEVLSYHSQASEDEIRHLKALAATPVNTERLLHFDFDPWSLSNDEKPLMVLHMFRELFQLQKLDDPEKYFDMDALIRFTLTVRKNYRNVPYHNWVHAFSVSHAMYTIIKLSEPTSLSFFTPLDVLSLFVSCVCHDIDHRGRSNSYMVKSATPLAALYTTSTMEQHHFNYTVSILQNEGHNVFRYLNSDDYKSVLDTLKHCILATDLALFFGNKIKLKELIESGNLDPKNDEHRRLIQAISMTSCDLVASTKPWNVQLGTVNVIFEEFFAQGDEEKLGGQQPIKMMDRDYKHELPEQQVGFINGICLPCYELLAKVLPQITPLVNGARSNLERWKQLAEEQKQKTMASKAIAK